VTSRSYVQCRPRVYTVLGRADLDDLDRAQLDGRSEARAARGVPGREHQLLLEEGRAALEFVDPGGSRETTKLMSTVPSAASLPAIQLRSART